MGSSGVVPFDSRTPTSMPIHRPALASQYPMSPAYSHGPMSSVPSPPYQPPIHGFPPGHHQSPTQPPMLSSPFRPEYPRKLRGKRSGSEDDVKPLQSRLRGSKTKFEPYKRSPSAKSETLASTVILPSNYTNNAKTITYNETLDPAHQIQFETGIDELMKVIQSSNTQQDGLLTPAPTPGSGSVSDRGSPVASIAGSPTQVLSVQSGATSKRRHICDGPNCNKSFTQRTHLEIHRRTHTGERPYKCPKPGCGLSFSQRGNLITHERRHSGERPFECKSCGKSFPQRSNLRSHEQTHKSVKPYQCRIADCKKSFSQLGNMKTHQNNYHAQELQELTSLFIRYSGVGVDDIPPQHRELLAYFKEHYKNSNKGIKGRGKDRKIAPGRPKTSPAKSRKPVSLPSMALHYQQPSPQSHIKVSAYPANQPRMKVPSNAVSSPDCNYSFYGQGHQQHGNAANMLYTNEQSRQMMYGTVPYRSSHE